METPVLPFLLPFVFAIICWVPSRLTVLRRFLVGGIAVISTASLLAYWHNRYFSPDIFGFDITITHNALWNLVSGRGVQCDPLQVSYYSIHPLFLLPCYLPFTLLFSHPLMLNLAHQGLALLSAALVFALARTILKSREAGIAAAAIFLLLPATSGSIVGECQPNFSGVPMLLAYFLCKEQGRHLLACLFAVLTAFSWEPFLAAMALEGLMELTRRNGDRRLGMTAFLAAVAALLLFVINRQTGVDISSSRHYTAVGGSPFAAIGMLFRNPVGLAKIVFSSAKIGLFVHLFLPLLFLPLFAPRLLLLCVPEWGLILLSNPGDDMAKINCFYLHVTMVIGIYALLKVVARFSGSAATTSRLLFIVLVNTTLLQFAYHHTFLRGTIDHFRGLAACREREMIELAPVELVPENARVVVFDHTVLIRFPRRHLIYPNFFLSPLVNQLWHAGEIPHDYLIENYRDDERLPDGYEVVARDWHGKRILKRVIPAAVAPPPPGARASTP